MIGDDSWTIGQNERHDVGGALPATVAITPGNTHDDPLNVEYGTWSTLTVAPACGVGSYDNGVRQIDCGFPCP